MVRRGMRHASASKGASDFDGIDWQGSPIGLLFPASPVIVGGFVYVTNLSLDLHGSFGLPPTGRAGPPERRQCREQFRAAPGQVHDRDSGLGNPGPAHPLNRPRYDRET